MNSPIRWPILVSIIGYCFSCFGAENPIKVPSGFIAEGRTTVSKFALTADNALQSSLPLSFKSAYFKDGTITEIRSSDGRLVILDEGTAGGDDRRVWFSGSGNLASFSTPLAAGGMPTELILATPYVIININHERFDLYQQSGLNPVVSKEGGLTVFQYPVAPDGLKRTVKLNANKQIVFLDAQANGKSFQTYIFAESSPEFGVPTKMVQRQTRITDGKKFSEVHSVVTDLKPIGNMERDDFLDALTKGLTVVKKPKS